VLQRHDHVLELRHVVRQLRPDRRIESRGHLDTSLLQVILARSMVGRIGVDPYYAPGVNLSDARANA
jgi:hypothetical protein